MTAATTEPRTQDNALIRSLEQLLASHDTQALARLRRSLRHLPDVPDARAWALVVPYTGARRDSQYAGLITACLWASWHHRVSRPASSARRNLGHALRAAVPPERRDREFEALCTADVQTLPRRLGRTVRLLADAGAAPDWSRLNSDIRAWLRGDHQEVLRRWSDGLYSPFHDTAQPAEAPLTGEQTTKDTP